MAAVSVHALLLSPPPFRVPHPFEYFGKRFGLGVLTSLSAVVFPDRRPFLKLTTPVGG